MKGLPKQLRDAFRMPRKSLPDALQEAIAPKTHKYHAIRTKCLYGHSHDSRKEAEHCLKLHELQKEGKIRNLICEPIYDLRVNGVVICRHMPDFDYEKRVNDQWLAEVMDVKGDWAGGRRPEWIIKHKMFCVLYPQINYVVV